MQKEGGRGEEAEGGAGDRESKESDAGLPHPTSFSPRQGRDSRLSSKGTRELPSLCLFLHLQNGLLLESASHCPHTPWKVETERERKKK